MTARGVNRVRVFVDDNDYGTYRELLRAEVRKRGWQCLAYCLMPNHVHLLIETPKPNLSVGMQRLHGFYAQLFNRRHVRIGHLFQGRFRSDRVGDEGHFLTVVRYIAMNPVAASLCQRPEDWHWSSHNEMAGGRRSDWLATTRLSDYLAEFAGATYTALMNAPLPDGY